MAITHNNSVTIPTRKFDKLNCKIMKMCSQPEQKEQSLGGIIREGNKPTINLLR